MHGTAEEFLDLTHTAAALDRYDEVRAIFEEKARAGVMDFDRLSSLAELTIAEHDVVDAFALDTGRRNDRATGLFMRPTPRQPNPDTDSWIRRQVDAWRARGGKP